jgi:ABC-2 type transport system permease protein
MTAVPSTVALVAHQLRYDLRAFRRNRQALVSTLVLPIVLLVVLVSANDGETATYAGRTVPLAQFVVPGLVAFGLIAASFLSLVVEVVAQREAGVLKRRRATPVGAAVLVGGRTLTAAVASLAVTWVLLAVAQGRYDVVVPGAGLPALVLTVLVGAMAFASLGYALASLIRTPAAAQPVASLVFLPFLLVSGVLVPADHLPDRLQTIARIFPVEHLAHALRVALDPAVTGHHLATGDLAVLAAWAVGAFVVAYRRFAWLPHRSAG